MGVAVQQRADLEAVDGLGEPRRAKEGKDLRRLARQRGDDRRVVQDDDDALGLQRSERLRFKIDRAALVSTERKLAFVGRNVGRIFG
jgi:hypothetical protein